MIKSQAQQNENNIPKNFEPSNIEKKWNHEWHKMNQLRAVNSLDSDNNLENNYSIQFPPPNVTGTLHMGHAFNQTIMDSLVRYNRMLGKNTVFTPGTDHAGIATQIVVERQLDKENKSSRHQIGKKQFIEEIWKWKEKSGNIITDQIKRLGISADWEREYFTMDDRMSIGVIETFVRLYNQGLIYRGKRLVNWDPKLLTAVSDLEVEMEEVDGHMWYIKYNILEKDRNKDHEDYLVVATTRPETIFADNAICIHPNDDRHKNLIGKHVYVPLTDRIIPIISDDFVDMKFGTGCVKITAAHDFNDYKCAMKHNLNLIPIFTKEANLNDNVPEKFRGLDRNKAREIVLENLKNLGLIIRTENHKMNQPKGDRTGVVLEPMLTDQWFVATNKPAPKDSLNPGKSLSEIALEVLDNNQIQFYPDNWKNTYKQWINNIEDWCISRQLWWGHQIPAWYSEDGQIFVAHNEKEAYEKAIAAGIKGPLKRDEDVLDTWFSSGLIPFTTMGWPKETPDLKKYLPSNVLVTGFDIIFFWVARMVMLTKHMTGKIPFKDVYVHGLIRDSEGKKMSKSKGNTLDPLDLIDGITLENLIIKRTYGLINPKQAESIKKSTRKQFPKGIQAVGTDALRFTMSSYATLGRDINFDIKRCEGYRNFCNKLWNATRFVLLNVENLKNISRDDIINAELSFADSWIISRLQNTIAEIRKGYSEYRFDNVANAIYSFVWDEFCDWYLEIAKVQLQQFSNNKKIVTQKTLLIVLESILRLAHPTIPFITEELWQKVYSFFKNKNYSQNNFISISTAAFPIEDKKRINIEIEKDFAELKSQIDAVRALRGSMNISPAERIPLLVRGNKTKIQRNAPYIIHFAKLKNIEILDELPQIDAPVQIVGETSLMLKIKIDLDKELLRLDKEYDRILQEINKCNIKLSNNNFLENAPENIVGQEKERLEKFQALLSKIKEQIDKIRNNTNR